MFDPSKLDLELDKKPSEEKPTSDNINHAPIIDTSNPDQPISTNITDTTTDSKIENTTVTETLSSDIPTLKEDNKVTTKIDEALSDPLLDLSNTSSKTQDLYVDDNTEKYIEEKIEENTSEGNNIIFDINITSLLDILYILIEKKYDFVTIEPNEDFIALSFKLDKVEKEVRYIKYPTYTAITLKIKSATKLNLEETTKEQQGKGEVAIKDTNYQIVSKVVPGTFGEKVFVKLNQIEKKVVAKKKEKISLGKIMGFFGASIAALLIIGGGFLAFVLFSANNVADLTFFNNLGVNVDSIKEFTSNLVDFIFFSILLIESIFLFIILFKAFLTKKEFKQKKISRMILAFFLLIITMVTGFVWLSLSKKINALNSQDYGKVIFYDNSKYLSQVFDEKGSKINIDDALIGPVTLRFQIGEFMKQINDSGFQAKKLTWVIGKEKIEASLQNFEFIREFNTQAIHNVSIEIEGLNIKGEEDTIVQEIANVNIAQVVDITEIEQKSGGSVFDFNASSLSNLGQVKWFYIPNLKDKTDEEQTKIIAKALEKEVVKGYQFTSKIIYDEEVIVGMQLSSKQDSDTGLDKIFIISKENKDTIEGEIKAERNKINDLEFTFSVTGADTQFGDGIIESFRWNIDNKPHTLEADLSNLEKSSTLEYTFKNYGNFDVSVTITDSRGKTKILNKNIEITKNLKLKNGISFSENNEILEDVKYDSALNEYHLSNIGVPTKIKLDTKNLGVDNKLYTLQEVYWDYNNNGDHDDTGKVGNISIDTPGAHNVSVEYVYAHRVLKEKTVRFKQTIFIDAEKKDALVLFEMKKPGSYTPVVVSFDASQSKIKDGNIQKFIWDYGDGIIEERDAIVPGHKYTKPGDYDITLKIIGEDGKTFEKTKKLILKPKPQSVEISSSLKEAPVGQEIDFSSQKSQGQITSYLWKFGDNNISSEANPSHKYNKPGRYKVELIVEFSNNNVETDSIEIEISDK